MEQNQMHPDVTDILHHMGEYNLPGNAVAPPLFQNSIFCFDSYESFHAALENEAEHYIYSRDRKSVV